MYILILSFWWIWWKDWSLLRIKGVCYYTLCSEMDMFVKYHVVKIVSPAPFLAEQQKNFTTLDVATEIKM